MRFMQKINEQLAMDDDGAFNHYISDLRTEAEKKYAAIFKELAGGVIGDDIDF